MEADDLAGQPSAARQLLSLQDELRQMVERLAEFAPLRPRAQTPPKARPSRPTAQALSGVRESLKKCAGWHSCRFS